MIDWWVNQMLELFPIFLHLNISWLLCILNRDSSDGGYIFVSIVESSQPLSPLQLLKLIVGFVGDRPIALFPFFLISYLFESWLLHVCSWFGKDGMKKVRFHASSCEKWKNTMNSPFLHLQVPPLPPTFKRDGGGERPELEGSKMALLFFPDCRNSVMSDIWLHNLLGRRTQWFFLPMWIGAERQLRAFVRRTALIRDQKKKQYSLRYCESQSWPAWHHGRSDFF